ncbi:MAG: hypothetical protein A3H69_05350 [Candidatus Sungbacteria bacterium RIFCSPLOWO2_02_FULL_47_9]|uniref:N-acetyltransferase domain-containing protein n=1 Tax=Candidatus Sungbacteria bacterium RIFCSPHIGHO2_01_FULL_47_32 TaxID=1802264 RepID=A0A1G2K6C6_9BACT|nr:MAG: hypothetical protein UX72_C0002G0009 [Parcubacteria group bacterium GW2011_GWA2_47_10]OGZ94994.1 MAG: hypothetical protein A2633_06030 [Candidatus Sungbacteria bacterium RIFCSPHIGHO2_01_FULL_47_32]OGZ99390.1 MAG: hypothetical protein A3D57_00845 [Candidatus Sungbacteria bacterium RIFCSPHIGHO2_02_FULL_46_12]OHA05659.1 MAG: hypothetical protein A3A28_04415 [Candidatus Sungbacteria bacterium RIFCSPLOWO2_01_FULL_47_32]OHA10222.1 MAG: hypothetical protein A3H69_05350 [Candidatus Sungbacteria
MIDALLLNTEDVPEVLEFYRENSHDEVLYPRDERLVRDNLGRSFFLTGIRAGAGEDLIAVAWMAKLKDFVYFVIENDSLIIKNDRDYAYSGGWLIRPDCRSAGVFKLLAAAVNYFWFTDITKNSPTSLWGRMVGKKDADGNPLFWNRVGERVTGISYHELLEFPFGTMEQEIFDRWPKEPLTFRDIPQDVLQQALGKTHEALIGPLNQFLRWGMVEISDRYVPTSLNRFHVTTENNIPDAEGFLYQAIRKCIEH